MADIFLFPEIYHPTFFSSAPRKKKKKKEAQLVNKLLFLCSLNSAVIVKTFFFSF